MFDPASGNDDAFISIEGEREFVNSTTASVGPLASVAPERAGNGCGTLER
jgi:hypothetical protein